jgi:hypothetical protein
MTSKMGDLREMRAVTGRLCHGEGGGTTMGTKKCEVEIEGERIPICFEAGRVTKNFNNIFRMIC